MVNILVVGSGGREHALSWKLSQSNHVETVYTAPGNGGTENNVAIDVDDLDFVENKEDLGSIIGKIDAEINGLF